MRVLVISDPHLPTPPVGYGGTERMAAVLSNGLCKNGYVVDLIAGPGSLKLNGQLYIHHVPGKSFLSRAFRKITFQILSLYASLKADVVINFGRVDYLWGILKLTRKPVLFRFANPIKQFEIDFILSERTSKIKFIGISKNQVKHLTNAGDFTIIYNALDLTAIYRLQRKERNYLLFIGRLTFNKGVDTAIRIATATGIPLLIAGNIPPREMEFYAKEVKPLLSDRIQYIGEVNDQQKNELYGGALATLFPIRWEEPFGIVMIESLACGTPVIAANRASVPEVIKNEETGFVCDTGQEMIAAVARVSSLSNEHCRREAEERFSEQVMLAAYIKILNEVSSA